MAVATGHGAGPETPRNTGFAPGGYHGPMCLIALAWRQHPDWPLVIAANRDEFHARASAPAGLDPDDPTVYGGRDLVQGGGWLQLSVRGKLAAVTNVRDASRASAQPRSRGWLVSGFVRGDADAGAFAAGPAAAGGHGPFNALFWDGTALVHATNHPGLGHAAVAQGIHAMSNGAFDAPWPKSTTATQALAAWLRVQAGATSLPATMDALEPLFAALASTRAPPDADLPDTGIGLDLERALAPPFVRGETYGTRCSTVVLVGHGAAVFAERRFGPLGRHSGDSLAHLPLAAHRPAAGVPRR